LGRSSPCRKLQFEKLERGENTTKIITTIIIIIKRQGRVGVLAIIVSPKILWE